MAEAILQERIVFLAMIYSRGHLDSGGTISLNVRMTHSIIPRVIGPTLSHSHGLFLHGSAEKAFLFHKRTLSSISLDKTMRLLSWGVLFSLRQSLKHAQLWTITDNPKKMWNVSEGFKRKPHKIKIKLIISIIIYR